MKLILLLIALTFAGNHELIKKYKLDEVVNCEGVEYNLWVYEIEGCEYIGPSSFTNVQFLVHKGNCKYCLERRKESTTTYVPPTRVPYPSRYLGR